MQRVRSLNLNSTGAMTTANNGFFGLQHEDDYLMGRLTFGGGNKNLVERVYWEEFFQMGEMIRFLKDIVQKPTQVTIPNLLNGWQAIAGFIVKWSKKASLVNKNIYLH